MPKPVRSAIVGLIRLIGSIRPLSGPAPVPVPVPVRVTPRPVPGCR